jgi:class 3 adenylate cyclase
MADALAELGLTVRIGLHAGEIEVGPHGTSGLAMHIAARVLDFAADGGIVASGTVRDLVFGSGVRFIERGEHELRGVPGAWSLFEVA